MEKIIIKRIFLSLTLFGSFLGNLSAQHHDDVYDNYYKKEKVKKSVSVYTSPNEEVEIQPAPEPQRPLESGEISTRIIQPNESNNMENDYHYQNEDNNNIDASEGNYRMSFTERLNRFEHDNQDDRWSWGVTSTWGSSNYGWNNGFNNWGWNNGFNFNFGWDNSWYDPWFGFNNGYTSIFIVNNNPWNNWGWNNGFNNWGWGNTWNDPFWGNPVVINNYYGNGFNPFNNYPHCINNYYNDYGPQRNVVYGPRGNNTNNTPQNNNYGLQQSNSGINYGKDVKNPINNQDNIVTPEKTNSTNNVNQNYYGNSNSTPIDFSKNPKNVVAPIKKPVNQENISTQDFNNGQQSPPIIKTPKNVEQPIKNPNVEVVSEPKAPIKPTFQQPIKHPSEEIIYTPKAPVKPQNEQPVKPQYQQPIKTVKEPKYVPQIEKPKQQQFSQPQYYAPKPSNNGSGIKTNKVTK